MSAVNDTAASSEPDLYSEPLAYPGPPVTRPGLLVDGEFRASEVRGITDLLANLGSLPLPSRHPVVAVGSNASLGQVRRKLGGLSDRLVVPFTMVTVGDLVPGVAAHVTSSGYVPATPIEAPGETSTLAVLWLDDEQLEAMDATEATYDRVPVPTGRFPLIAGADVVAATRPYEMYASRRGCLTDQGGTTPLRLLPQPALIQGLLDGSPALLALAGSTPECFVATMRKDAESRERAREILVQEGRVVVPG